MNIVSVQAVYRDFYPEIASITKRRPFHAKVCIDYVDKAPAPYLRKRNTTFSLAGIVHSAIFSPWSGLAYSSLDVYTTVSGNTNCILFQEKGSTGWVRAKHILTRLFLSAMVFNSLQEHTSSC
jgi:hypothetical protein